MVVVEGTVVEIVFCNEANGYTVCDLNTGKKTVTAVGYMPFINEGETLKITGKWVTHPDYGRQLRAEMYEKILPRETDKIEKYLASGIIKGVGPATSRKIVERFGDKTMDIIQLTPERLSEIKGISLEKALNIGKVFSEQKELREVMLFLQEYGISPYYCTKIYKIYGSKTIEEIKNNPYKLADGEIGIGFKTADKIAMNIGIDASSTYRICSAIKYVLSQAASNGHTYVPEDKLKEYTARLLQIDPDLVENALIKLVLDKTLYTHLEENTRNIYLAAFYNAEINVCRRLVELSSIRFKGDLEDFDRKIQKVQDEEGIILAERQITAIREALINGVLVITGGPGTGKTTIIKNIIKLLDKEGYRVALAAPTGRAAKRMSEAAGFEAKTIHRLLEIGFSGDKDEMVFNKTENNPIDADVVIIDEVSMVDILLMNHLLKAIEPGSRLILVGDADQLPSVGPGNVLKDIIASQIIKTVKLTEIFRQAEESMITVNAHRINSGLFPYMNSKDGGFYFISRRDAKSIVETVVELCQKRIPETYGLDPMRDIQVLTPTRKGLVGVANLNVELQKALNPPSPDKKEKSIRDYLFREGDRVMQIKNNYNLQWKKAGENSDEGVGVFNGDAGIILEIDNEEQMLKVIFDDEKIVEYDYSILDEIEPAFATTIHKSQGSEFPVVIIPIFPGPPILMTRNLLYTAITRAKNLVILVGMQRVMNEMIQNSRETLRYSGLGDKLKKLER